MLFMNEHEINEAVERHRQHPVLGQATRFLKAYKDEVNSHSDGWSSWSAPVHAAAKLITLIQTTNAARWQSRPPADVTKADVIKAMTPIKAFMTRRGTAAGMKLPPFSFDPQPATPQPVVDRTAEATIAAIVKILDAETWSPDTLDAIADVLRSAGYTISDDQASRP